MDQVLARTQAQDLKTLATEVAKVTPGTEIDITQDDATIRTLLAGTKDIRGILEGLMTKTGTGDVLDGNGAAGLWESRKQYETPTGNVIVAGTDMGIDYKPYNEDRIAVHTGTEFVAALDGVG